MTLLTYFNSVHESHEKKNKLNSQIADQLVVVETHYTAGSVHVFEYEYFNRSRHTITGYTMESVFEIVSLIYNS